MRIIGLSAWLVFWALIASAADLPDNIRVPRWQPQDFAFHSQTEPVNPFQVRFAAVVAGPNGTAFSTPGFYDGQQTWKLRLAPNAEGQWSAVTQSDLPELDGKRISFMCVPNANPTMHGAVQVDPQHPRHFVCEDGTRFCLLGYECDWLWALDLGKPTLTAVDAFLDKLAAYGFNYVILNAYAHDTGWRKGNTGDDDFGPPPLYAWAGTNENPDHSRFNLPYWQHYDRVIDALFRRGMVAHVMVKVYNKQVRWPVPGSADDDLYFRWLVARYAAYPHVHWDFSKEAHNEKDFACKAGRFQWFRQWDPYHRLLTVHDDKAAYDRGAYDALLDYRCDQQHSKWHETLLAHRAQRAWPVVNVEFGYEHGPGGPEDKTYAKVQPPEEVCRRAWEIMLAGGYTAYYYTYTAWDVLRPQDTPPGYAYFQHLREFFESTGYWLMEPADQLVSAGYCLAAPGQEYIVFLNQAGPLTLKLEGLSGPAKADWFHPLTAERQDAGAVDNGTVSLKPPAAWSGAPVALHVGSRRR